MVKKGSTLKTQIISKSITSKSSHKKSPSSRKLYPKTSPKSNPITIFLTFLYFLGSPIVFTIKLLVKLCALIGDITISIIKLFYKWTQKILTLKITFPKVKGPLFSFPKSKLVLPDFKFSLPSQKLKIPKIHLQVRVPSWKLATLVSLTIVGAIFYQLILKDLPDPKTLSKRNQLLTTQIYDRNGTLLYKLYKDQNRTLVPLSKIPPDLIKAVIAIEDKNFYSHHGFSPVGALRALITNMNDPGALQGGSTITQQLIKNTLLTKEKSLVRKIKEVILAIQTETLYSKNDILEMYLNEVGFGGPTYGVQEAAQFYFGKNVDELDLHESSFIAGLPQAPTRLSPFGVGKQMGKQRQKQVLESMVHNNFLSAEQAQLALDTQLNFADPKIKILAPHFVQYVTDLLVKEYGDDLYTKGLQITTSLDINLQSLTQDFINQELKRIGKLNVTNGAALITNPKSGEILAMVGSKNFFDNQIDGQVNMTTALRQPGSTVKPINYALAFENGLSPATRIDDSPLSINLYGTNYSPTNYDNRYHGTVTLRSALANSYNIPAVKILMQNGTYNMARLASRLGITTWEDENRFGPSMTLGSLEVKMTDMAEVYGTLANQGIRIPLKSIINITDSSGKKLSVQHCDKYFSSNQFSCAPGYIIKASTAYLITDILKDPLARSQAFGLSSILNVPGQEVAVKTGTSNQLKDNWTIGYTTDYLVASWVGNNDGTPMSSVASGITGASPIWHNIVASLTKGQKHAFKKPDTIVTVALCQSTGTLTCKECPSVKIESFPAGQEPKSACSAKDFAVTEDNRPLVQNINTYTALPVYRQPSQIQN